MGRGGGVVGGRPPSQTAYFVALGGVATLLLMLCCYFLYFCVSKINELSERASLCAVPASSRPAARPDYPVQPVVRDSATAIAKICKQLPTENKGQSDTVFPTSTSPAAVRADTGDRTDPAGQAAASDVVIGLEGMSERDKTSTVVEGMSERDKTCAVVPNTGLTAVR